MSKAAYARYQWIEAQLESDPEYLALMERLRHNEPAFHAALDALNPEQREAIIEHMGICAELAERTTEICCFMP
jgi:hypothetical protein